VDLVADELRLVVRVGDNDGVLGLEEHAQRLAHRDTPCLAHAGRVQVVLDVPGLKQHVADDGLLVEVGPDLALEALVRVGEQKLRQDAAGGDGALQDDLTQLAVGVVVAGGAQPRRRVRDVLGLHHARRAGLSG